MRNSHLAVILGLWLAVAACSSTTQDTDLQEDLQEPWARNDLKADAHRTSPRRRRP